MPDKTPQRGVDRHHLQQIIANLDEGVLLIEPDGAIAWANDAALAMHACKRTARLGASMAEYRKRFVFHDPDGRRFTARNHPVARLLAGETFSNVVVRLARRNDKDFQCVLDISGLILTGPDDEPESLVLLMKDVTEQFHAEERFERAFAANPAPALILRLDDSRYIKANKGFLEMTGYANDEVVGRPLRELDILRDAEHRDEAIRALDRHATIPQQESSVRTRDGGSKFVIVAGQPIEMNEQPCMLFTFNDLDARKQAETSLRQSEERFAKAFRLAPVPMLVCTLRGLRVIEANEAFATATLQPHEEIVGQSIADAGIPADDDLLRELGAAPNANRSIRNRDVQLRTRDGAMIHGLLSAEPVSIQDEACVLFVVQDITERKRTEADLITAIETVMKDTSWFSRTLVEKLAQIRHPESTRGELGELTTREREILELICKGMDDAGIASALGISRNTVRNHVATLYGKINVNRRSAAMVWGRERGLGSY